MRTDDRMRRHPLAFSDRVPHVEQLQQEMSTRYPDKKIVSAIANTSKEEAERIRNKEQDQIFSTHKSGTGSDFSKIDSLMELTHMPMKLVPIKRPVDCGSKKNAKLKDYVCPLCTLWMSFRFFQSNFRESRQYGDKKDSSLLCPAKSRAITFWT